MNTNLIPFLKESIDGVKEFTLNLVNKEKSEKNVDVKEDASQDNKSSKKDT